MRVFWLLLERQVGAHDHVAELCGLAQEPFEIGMQLGTAARDVHGPETAGLESFKALLERLVRHRFGFLRSALEIAMTTCQVACIGDVHLHGRLMVASLKQRRLTNALFERQVVSSIVGILEHL